jgi:hypothetical protein
MGAAEAALEELFAALLRRPFNLCNVGRHVSSSPSSWVAILAERRASGDPGSGYRNGSKTAAAEFPSLKAQELDPWGD